LALWVGIEPPHAAPTTLSKGPWTEIQVTVFSDLGS
jgi:hypothetical protein